MLFIILLLRIMYYCIIVLVLIAMIGTSCERAFKQPMKPVYFVLEW